MYRCLDVVIASALCLIMKVFGMENTILYGMVILYLSLDCAMLFSCSSSLRFGLNSFSKHLFSSLTKDMYIIEQSP